MATVIQIRDFIKAAGDYCRARREYLDINKRMRGLLGCNTCEVEGQEGYDWVPPCFHWDSEIFHSEEEWCDYCRPHYADAHRRDVLRPQFSRLMRAMLKAWMRFDES